jgi:hypothetical protein
MTPFELQQSLERYTGHFIDSVTDALHEVLQSEQMSTARAGMNRLLLYCTSALDIATGPIPEVNAVDMVVFMALNRSTIESHWLPHVFGNAGRPLLDAFVSAEREVQEISAAVLNPSQQQELHELIRDWLATNPGRIAVEWVRFQDFANKAREVEQARAKRARGLLGNVKFAA